MQPLQVRAEASATANQSLSDAYLLLRDCTCGRRTRRSPTYAHHPYCAERHDRSMLQVPCSKRNVHHRVQKSPVVKAERYVGKERGRIDSIELRKEEKSDRLSNGIFNHRGPRIQDEYQRASLCDYTQWLVGGVQNKSARHDRSDQARGSRRCAYLAVIGSTFAVFSGDWVRVAP
jgi:hypothetical protein